AVAETAQRPEARLHGAPRLQETADHDGLLERLRAGEAVLAGAHQEIDRALAAQHHHLAFRGCALVGEREQLLARIDALRDPGDREAAPESIAQAVAPERGRRAPRLQALEPRKERAPLVARLPHVRLGIDGLAARIL